MKCAGENLFLFSQKRKKWVSRLIANLTSSKLYAWFLLCEGKGQSFDL